MARQRRTNGDIHPHTTHLDASNTDVLRGTILTVDAISEDARVHELDYVWVGLGRDTDPTQLCHHLCRRGIPDWTS